MRWYLTVVSVWWFLHWASFQVPLAICKNVFLNPLPIFNWTVFFSFFLSFLLLSSMSSLYIRYVICKSFLSFHKLPYHLLMISLPCRNFLVWYSLTSFLLWGWGAFFLLVSNSKTLPKLRTRSLHMHSTGIHSFKLFALLRFADISVSYRLKVCGKTGLSKLLRPFSEQHLLTLCLSVTFW